MNAKAEIKDAEPVLLESNRAFWTRLADDELRMAKVWRRRRRFKDARHSIALVREWRALADK